MSRWTIIAIRFALLAGALALWELLPRLGVVNTMLLPPLSDVLPMLGDILSRPKVHAVLNS